MNEKNQKKSVTISVRVPAWLKSEMEKTDINWSEYIRKVIEDRIKLERAKKIWAEIEDIVNSEGF